MSGSITDQLGQLMIIGIDGFSLSAEEKNFIVQNDIGGVILFSRNIQTADQLRDLCDEIQSLSSQQKSKLPLFVSVDMEGGRVHRLKPPFTQWPALGNLGVIDNPTISYHFAKAMGLELFAAGFNLNFAPCLDIFNNPKNQVIGDRAVGTTPATVEKHASALVRGYIKSHIIPCVKHFPGHGNTLLDSHDELPVEDSNFGALEQRELIPFKKAFRSKADLVMTSHLLFKNIDPDWPVTLSEKFLGPILREACRFRGVVVTDDMDMKALTKNYAKDFLPVKALKAGADILLYCNEPASPRIAIEAMKKAVSDRSLDLAKLQNSFDRVNNLKQKIVSELPSKKHMMSLINDGKHKQLADAIRAQHVEDSLMQLFDEAKED